MKALLFTISLFGMLTVASSVRAEDPPQYLIQWGSYGTGDGQFNYPFGVAVDATGNVLVADEGNHRIQKFTSSGDFLLTWGAFGHGDGELYFPAGIAVDVVGNVYVADQYNNRVQKFTGSGTFLMVIGGPGMGDGEFQSPTTIAVDNDGFLYVVDHGNNRIQKFNPNGEFVLAWGSYGSGPGQFSRPYGVAVDVWGHVFVCELAGYRIQKFTTGGEFVSSFGDFSSFDLAVDQGGNVYVGNANSIVKFDNNGVLLTQWGSTGMDPGQFNRPYGIAVDGRNNVYVVDSENHRVQVFGDYGTSVHQFPHYVSWGRTKTFYR